MASPMNINKNKNNGPVPMNINNNKNNGPVPMNINKKPRKKVPKRSGRVVYVRALTRILKK